LNNVAEIKQTLKFAGAKRGKQEIGMTAQEAAQSWNSLSPRQLDGGFIAFAQ
jgi:hypothetical protein